MNRVAYILLMLILGTGLNLKASDLGPGGVAITAWNADVDDDFSFVLLENISGTTEIYFTDQGWDSTNNTWNTNGEGEILWTYTGVLYAGTEIEVSNPSSSTPTVSLGTVTKTGSFNITATADQIIAYSGTGVPNDGSEVTNFIWAVYSGSGTWGFANNTSQTDLPSGLVDGETAVDFGTADNYQYNCDASYNPDSANLSYAQSSNFISGSSNEDYAGPGCGRSVSSALESILPGSGYALEFDGANDYIELGNDPDLTFTDKMTIEFWAKTDASVGNYNTMVSKWYSGGDINGGSYSFYYTNSGLQFALQDTGNANLSVSTTQYYNDGEWHHFAGSWDGDSARLFVDGIKIGTSGSASFGNYLDQDTRSTRIGTDDRYTPGSGDRHFEGSIDEVRFWRAELDQETIQVVSSNTPNTKDEST